LRELSLFSGAGGGLLGTKIMGWNPVGYVEFNDYCQRILAQRIKDGLLDNAPIFGDIRAFIREGYADSYKGLVDVITAGFPCQPFSICGRGKAERDDRNMWFETKECIRIIRPKIAWLENVPNLLGHKYIRHIFADLAEMGLHARWGVLGSTEVGGICESQRLWILVTQTNCAMLESMDISQYIKPGTKESFGRQYSRAVGEMLSQDDYTVLKRNTDAVATGMEQLKAIGNGQVPFVVKQAYEILNDFCN